MTYSQLHNVDNPVGNFLSNKSQQEQQSHTNARRKHTGTTHDVIKLGNQWMWLDMATCVGWKLDVCLVIKKDEQRQSNTIYIYGKEHFRDTAKCSTVLII